MERYMLNPQHGRLWTPQDVRALSLRERVALLGLSGGAGNYTDLPEHRLEYDRDGTAMLRIDPSNNITERSSAEMQELNDEDTGAVDFSAGQGTTRLVFIFPELRDIVAYFVRASLSGSGSPAFESLERSADTTNGLDGSWTSVVNPYTVAGAVKPNYRTAIQTVSINAMKAVRFNWTAGTASSSFAALHLYGKRSATATKYLTFWRPSSAASVESAGDARATAEHFDWGNAARSSSQDRKFRVKNEHGSLTANDVTITIEALTDTTPSVPGQFLFSSDGVTFVASLNIGNLAPGALSGDIWVRRNTPSNAVLSLWSARVLAEADGGWS